jgi:hypothetical protein
MTSTVNTGIFSTVRHGVATFTRLITATELKKTPVLLKVFWHEVIGFLYGFIKFVVRQTNFRTPVV